MTNDDDENWTDEQDEITTAVQAWEEGETDGVDNALIRWTSMLVVQGYKESEIRRRLSEADLDRRLTQQAFKRLMALANKEAEDLKHYTIAKAEMGDTDWLRLDSYARRKRLLAMGEGIIFQAHGLADSVTKLNNVSWMINGLVKQQDALDKMSGAQDAKPQVVVNIGYDPIEQFRAVVQEELRTIDSDYTVIEANTPKKDSIDEEE